MKLIRYIFWSWMTIGLLLMLFYKVPEPLGFSNGLFLVFFAFYAVSLEQKSLGGFHYRVMLRALFVGAFTFMLEWVGTETGWPFGRYEYSETLRFWSGGVPAAIGFAWIGVMSSAILLCTNKSYMGRALQAGLYAVAFDLVLDPVAFAQQFWTWSGDAAIAAYYGVPLQNFAAWFLTAAMLSFLYPLKAEHRQVKGSVYREGIRLYQGMHAMFGLLACKSGLWGPFLMAVIVIVVLEGGILYYDRSKQKQMV
ncbi:putative membrane protein [Paenibacillus castaneae]|uniref:carotenoid biosynthesis protein n=1 Tax=Paenibacillus castaneae TaxID=474957 RepID=UPI000C9A012C|nr:carotenoid biosynthesis protein [Paenibacillus castaneae]NIK76022.1 putative membrane protein [Paenibacillus castaneae]